MIKEELLNGISYSRQSLRQCVKCTQRYGVRPLCPSAMQVHLQMRAEHILLCHRNSWASLSPRLIWENRVFQSSFWVVFLSKNLRECFLSLQPGLLLTLPRRKSRGLEQSKKMAAGRQEAEHALAPFSQGNCGGLAEHINTT